MFSVKTFYKLRTQQAVPRVAGSKQFEMWPLSAVVFLIIQTIQGVVAEYFCCCSKIPFLVQDFFLLDKYMFIYKACIEF